MKKNISGFTLVELLVVIAIIGVLATAGLSAIRSAQNQAKTSKCAANLHALHQATMSYFADVGKYPLASSVEVWGQEMDSFGNLHDYFKEQRAWVNWVRTDGTISRAKSAGNLYPGGNSGSTQAGKYRYATVGSGNDYLNTASDVYRSIDEGCIFKYTDKNKSIYCCQAYQDKHGGKGCMRTFMMNMSFGSARNRKEASGGMPGRITSRLAMFVEVADNPGKLKSCKNVTGKDGKGNAITDVYYDDSSWDWDKDEPIGAWHRKAGADYGHVIFADGHVESFKQSEVTGAFKDEIGSGSDVEL